MGFEQPIENVDAKKAVNNSRFEYVMDSKENADKIKNHYSFILPGSRQFADLAINGRIIYDVDQPITIEEDSTIQGKLDNRILRKGDLIIVTTDGKHPEGEDWELINDTDTLGVKTAVWAKKTNSIEK